MAKKCMFHQRVWEFLNKHTDASVAVAIPLIAAGPLAYEHPRESAIVGAIAAVAIYGIMKLGAFIGKRAARRYEGVADEPLL